MFSGILGAERCPRVQIPGLRSLSWGVWTCSSQLGNDNPASQERPPQCSTARVLLTSYPNACPETRRQSDSRKPPDWRQSAAAATKLQQGSRRDEKDQSAGDASS